ncbi:TPA: succinate-semialdehyde dehydrogenase, partial [Candidatus Azambacteria bacterium]|nr:succinate-semialdehyde dehydrogenase [Candidatus Azambacteria bacterium]
MDSITIVNPATGCQERRVRITPPDELLKMFENARIAQKQWAAVPLKERKKALRRLQRYLQNNYQEFIDAVQLETGKVWA